MTKLTQVVALYVLVTSVALAQTVDPQNVLIRNLYIVSNTSADQSRVNLLIRDNVLELVSQDDIPVPDGFTSVDAEGGFLLGVLRPGETPSFIILNQDPRTNFDVLLDTEEHAVFAVHEGQLRRQNLFESLPGEATPEPSKPVPGWLAYTPPPMALPLSYGDSSKWNKWESSYIDGIFIAGVVLDRQRWLTQNDASRQQVGDLNDFDGGEIRGFRLGVAGTLNLDNPWYYTVFAATNAFDKGFDTERTDDLTFFDYRLDIPFWRGTTLSVGKQKEPVSMERIMSMAVLPMQERTSVSDALLPARNFGAVLNGWSPTLRMTWAGGLFNDWYEADKSIGTSSTELVGRVTWLPILSEDESNLLHLGVGLRTSNGKDGVRYGTEPEFDNSPVFVDTAVDGLASDVIDSSGTIQYNLEASWRRGPYWVAFEYIGTDVDSPSAGNLEFSGYHITGSWILSGEMRPYSHKNGTLASVPVAQSVYQGGWGAWELSTRFSSIDLTDGPIDGGQMNILSLGANWWLTPIFNVNMNYRYIELDRLGLSGNSNGINARVLLMLE